MPDLYKLLTRSPWLNRAVNRTPALIGAVNDLPMPVRFSDDRRRVASFRLLRMVRTWADYPEEARGSYDHYDGGDVVDVGAYHGFYAALLATKARPGDTIVCCEPDRAAYAELLHNLSTLARLFPAVTFVPVPLAVGDGRPAAITYPEGSGHPRIGSAGEAGAPPTATLDDLVAQLGLRPRYVKVDVEGAESYVLGGMTRTLASHRPRVMLEIHPHWQPDGVTVADLEGVLRDAGYACAGTHADELAVRQWWALAATAEPVGELGRDGAERERQ
jgi:FkbM family methyltransferase